MRIAEGGAPGTALALTRKELAERTHSVLNAGGWGNPDVLLVDLGAGQEGFDAARGFVVVKDFAPRSWLVRVLFGRRLLRREGRAYARLKGIAAVPAMLGWIDDDALVLEYRPGTLLSRSLAGKLPGDFMKNLEAAVSEMHDRGVVHLDLRHRSNLLADGDGRPVMIDFASALFLNPRGFPGRWLLSLFARFDQGAIEKWRVRLFPAGDAGGDGGDGGGGDDGGDEAGGDRED